VHVTLRLTEQSQQKKAFLGLLMWSGRRDSNSRPPAPKAGALAKLRHAPSTPIKYNTIVALGQDADVVISLRLQPLMQVGNNLRHSSAAMTLFVLTRHIHLGECGAERR
jgi:hypothetical protein